MTIILMCHINCIWIMNLIPDILMFNWLKMSVLNVIFKVDNSLSNL